MWYVHKNAVTQGEATKKWKEFEAILIESGIKHLNMDEAERNGQGPSAEVYSRMMGRAYDEKETGNEEIAQFLVQIAKLEHFYYVWQRELPGSQS